MRKTEMWKKILLSMVGIYLISFLGNPFIKSALAEERHGHRAHHEGVLNVIGKELGHVEILLQGETLEAWFVGGGRIRPARFRSPQQRSPLP